MAKEATKAKRAQSPVQALMMSVNKGMGDHYKALAEARDEATLDSTLAAIRGNLETALKGLGKAPKADKKADKKAAPKAKAEPAKKAPAKKTAAKKAAKK